MDGFFRCACIFDEVEVIDLLCHRYASIDFILDLPIETFVEVLLKAKKEEDEERLHRQYCSMLEGMADGRLKYISFEKYVRQCKGQDIDLRPVDEIRKEIYELHGIKE